MAHMKNCFNKSICLTNVHKVFLVVWKITIRHTILKHPSKVLKNLLVHRWYMPARKYLLVQVARSPLVERCNLSTFGLCQLEVGWIDHAQSPSGSEPVTALPWPFRATDVWSRAVCVLLGRKWLIPLLTLIFKTQLSSQQKPSKPA